jgi:hypothetical protein
MMLFKYRDMTWKLCLIWIICGLLFGLLMTLQFSWMRRKLMKRLLDFDETEIDGNILQKGLMNHFKIRGILAVGGFGFLLDDRLIFVQHKRKQTERRVTVPFSDITNISGIKFLGIFNTGLKITLQSGETERFVVDKQTDFYKAFIERVTKNIK